MTASARLRKIREEAKEEMRARAAFDWESVYEAELVKPSVSWDVLVEMEEEAPLRKEDPNFNYMLNSLLQRHDDSFYTKPTLKEEATKTSTLQKLQFGTTKMKKSDHFIYQRSQQCQDSYQQRR